MDNIIEKHEGYTKITYPRKPVILLHSIWDEDGIYDTYPNLWPGEPEIVFDEDMTVKNIGYRTGCFINRLTGLTKLASEMDRFQLLHEGFWPPEQETYYHWNCRKGVRKILIFCPTCGKLALKTSDVGFVRDIRFCSNERDTIICRNCGEHFELDRKNFTITDGYREIKNPVKYNTRQWTSALLFSEENADREGHVSIIFNQIMKGANATSFTPFQKTGAVRITMNMKTGMTYLMNKKINGKWPEKDMRIITGKNNIMNVTYGGFGVSRCRNEYFFVETPIADMLNDHFIISFFAESLIRYKKIKKEDITKAGDFSDTSFWKLCMLNIMPDAAKHADVLEKIMEYTQDPGDWAFSKTYYAAKKCLKKIRKVFEKGPEYAAGYYMSKKVPRSIRKMIAKDITNYYVYKTLRKVGFENTDLIRMLMSGTDLHDKMRILALGENRVGAYGDKKNVFAFVRDMIGHFGEKKTANIIKGSLSQGPVTFEDAVMMYSLISPEKRVFKGKNIVEIHDALLPEYRKTKLDNVPFDYTKNEKALEGDVDGTTFYLPKDSHELSDASCSLHNCVRGYCTKILIKESTIVLMKRREKLVGCIELKKKRVVQAFAPCNNYFPKKDNDIFTAWCLKNGLKGKANGWECA